MSDVVVELRGPIAVVELNRPPDNYFDESLLRSLADELNTLDSYQPCRAIVLTSRGKHFCAGAQHPGSDSSANRSSLYEQAYRLFATRKPIVAAVTGAAIGGGLGLSLVADFRVASSQSRFSASFSRLGFHHGFGLTVTLPAVVGQQKALDLLYTGRRIGGVEAFRIGLCDRLADDDQVRAAAEDLAREIAGSAPLAVQSIRQTMRGDISRRVLVAIDREKFEQDRLAKTSDFSEGVQAMTERRTPRFVGQ